MTTIIGRSIKNKITMYWDKRVTWWFNLVSECATKIIKLDWVLIWICWDYVDIDYMRSIYEWYKKQWGTLDEKFNAMQFATYLAESSKKKDISIMFLCKEYQIIISDNSIENIYLDKEWDWIISMWSWFWTVLSLYSFDKDISIEDMYKISNSLDHKTSTTFNSLTL